MENGPAGNHLRMQQPPILCQRHPRRPVRNAAEHRGIPQIARLHAVVPAQRHAVRSRTAQQIVPGGCFPDRQVRTQCADGPGGRKHVYRGGVIPAVTAAGRGRRTHHPVPDIGFQVR